MTLAEQLYEEGYREGFLEGFQVGYLEGLIEVRLAGRGSLQPDSKETIGVIDEKDRREAHRLAVHEAASLSVPPRDL